MRRSSLILCCALSGAVLSSSGATAQQVSLLADINRETDRFKFYPDFHGGDGGIALFLAADDQHGNEPWITDGTPQGTRLIADMQPGAASTSAVLLGRIGDRVVFAAGPDSTTMSIWAADPPYSNPVLISDARAPGVRVRSSGSRLIPQSASLGDVVVFSARTPAGGLEIWATEGTPESTRMISDINPGEDDSSPIDFFVAGDVAYFAATNIRSALWRTDGTENGTYIIHDTSESMGFQPAEFFDAGDYVYFFAAGAERELWRTDGTTKGTARVHEIAPGAPDSSASGLTGNESTLYFYAISSGETGLFALDIESTSLSFIAPIAGVPFNSPLPPAITSAGAFFIRSTPEHGDELWITDGTPDGTAIVRDINPGAASGAIHSPVAVGDRVVFHGDDGKSGPSLWSSDGTPEGTVRLVPAVDWLWLYPGALTGDRLVMTLNDGVQGFTFWATDGTVEGTAPLVAPPQPGVNAGSFPGGFQFVNNARNNVVFSADDGIHGFEPWLTNAGGDTLMIRDLRPGQLSPSINGFVPSADQAFFTAYDNETGTELWRTDGTSDGTRLVRDIAPGALSAISTHLAAVPAGVVFGANTAETGNDLWFSDGTEANTRMIQNITPAFVSFQVHAVDDRAYFAPFSGATANTLRATDGSAVQNVASVSGALIWAHTNNVARIDGTLVFVAQVLFGETGRELWAKPAIGPAVSLGEIEPGPASPDVSPFVQSSSLAFFSAFSSTAGYELWRTDGTPGGTSLALDIVPGSASSTPEQLTVAGDQLFFTARTPAHGRELWISDGTPAGTRLVADISPGPASSTPLSLTATGNGSIVFSALTAECGAELWESDGTPAGTRMISDILPGPQSSGPANFFVTDDGTILFAATDGVHGRELWRYDPHACPCDWNSSDSLDSSDFFDFLIDFFEGNADFNASGATDSSDFFDFLICFFSSCS